MPAKTWLITGASTGLGRALAAAALARGDNVAASARNPASLAPLLARYPATALIPRLDVTDKPSINAAIHLALQTFGQIDVLVNNAGFGLAGAIEEVSDQQIRDQFETNFFGLLNVTRALLPTLRQQRSGHILNISSLGGRLTVPAMGLYHASKFALEGLSESLAAELKAFHIHLTIVEPGGFATDFASRSLQSAAHPLPVYQSLRDQLTAYTANFLLGNPDEAAKTLLRLVDSPNPPLRLPLGPNSLPRLLARLQSEIEAYKETESLWRTSTLNPIPTASLKPHP
jgi:NAD(P)-dependent dehydrogenase (short-subunit alcohol dehydrogenase family)